MIEFLNNPIVEVVADDLFVLREDFELKYFDHTFLVPNGFLTDFASVPRIPIVFALFAGRAKKSAVFHDWLYTTKPFSREECDKAFLCAMETEGLAFAVRTAMYSGVRFGGSSRWEKA